LNYVVQPGDNLWSIAARFGISAQAIAAANQLTNQHMIQVGQTLYIPTASSPAPVPAPGPTVPPTQYPFSASVDERTAKLEKDFNQVITIVDNHRRQIADLSRRLQRLEQR
jgi:spore germination protein YaaH